jgi:2-keto-4-pentenoate hydratase
MTSRIEEMAEALVRARTDLKQIPPLRESHGLDTVEDAYAVQDAANRVWLDQGRRLVGRARKGRSPTPTNRWWIAATPSSARSIRWPGSLST